MTTDSTRPLSSIDLLGEAEHARLDEWGNRAVLTQPARPVSIPSMFAAQVARTPSGVALRCGERSWTYRELDESANRLAHVLSGHGARPGECVALLMERSAEAIIAILAVLKTGAAYLPIDPAYPSARVEFMVADAAPIAAITTAGLAARFDGCGLAIVDVDDPAVHTQPSTVLPPPEPDDIAHVIYTSGTTGVPKGVAVTHHNVTRLFDSMDLRLELTPEQVWTQCHSYAFAVPFLRLRLLGLGDLGRAAAWRTTGRGPRVGGGFSRRPPLPARTGTRHRAQSNPFRGHGALTRGFGIGRADGGR
jgi:non-ribosomal peptide synthetase component F